MARKKSYYKGKSVCKGNCSGHRAGARYARNGGKIPSRHSGSFNAGMRIELGTFRAVTVAPARRRSRKRK